MATLSDRYIADRFLPDKAIDLVDESAAKLKMEISSKPTMLDEIDREILKPKWKDFPVAPGASRDARSIESKLHKLEQDLNALTAKQTVLT